MSELAAKVERIIREVQDPAFAAELVIDVVLRGVGRLGGRPRKETQAEPVTNRLETGSKPVSEVFQRPTQQRDLDLRSGSETLCPESSPDPAKVAPEPPADTVATFPTAGKVREWHLTAGFVEQCRQGYPGLDVDAEFRKARVWAEANPQGRKTAMGMSRFLANWLARANDRGGGGRAPPVRDVRVGHVRATTEGDFTPGEKQL